MISYIKGTVAAVLENSIILDNNGIGYSITMPSSSLFRLEEGDSDVKVFTHMAVREDDVSLFGFLQLQELEMFKLLITVSGIGPKAAISILSSIDVNELKMAIAAEDSKLISGAKGIGAKTAQKIVIELKGKFSKELLTVNDVPSGAKASGKADMSGKAAAFNDAVNILEALGFTRTSAVRALNQLEITEEMDSSEIVTLALRIIE